MADVPVKLCSVTKLPDGTFCVRFLSDRSNNCFIFVHGQLNNLLADIEDALEVPTTVP